MGNPAKPTALKLIQGNPGKRKLNKKEPKAPAKKLVAPSYLSAWGKRRFAYWAKLLAQYNISTALDTGALAKLVDAEDEYQQLSEVIAQHGVTQQTTNTNGDPVIKPNPAVAQRADAWRRVNLMMQQFGLTPASRAKVNAEEPAGDDPLEKFGLN